MYFSMAWNILPRTSAAGGSLHCSSDVLDHGVPLDGGGHDQLQPVDGVAEVHELMPGQVLEQGRSCRPPDWQI